MIAGTQNTTRRFWLSALRWRKSFGSGAAEHRKEWSHPCGAEGQTVITEHSLRSPELQRKKLVLKGVKVVPTSSYYVVAFTHENPLARDNNFHSEGVRLIKDSVQRIGGLNREQLQGLEYAIVYTLPMLPPHLRQQFQNANIKAGAGDQGQQQEKLNLILNPPAEYEGYDQVHFLNEVALRMYREAGIDLEVLKTISEDDLPEGCNRSLRGPSIRKLNIV